MKETNEMSLVDWLVQYKPNVVNLGCVPGGEESYVKAQDIIKATVPGTPIRAIQIERKSDSPNALTFDYRMCGITKDEIFLSDLTLVALSNGELLPVRVTNSSPSGLKFTL